MPDISHDSVEENNVPSNPEQELLPKNIAEYIQKARDELKEYEEHKKFYETKRKKEIILDLATLLEEYHYPRDFLSSILARELGEYVSTRYIEKILAEKYPAEKKVTEESTSQIANSSRNDKKIPIEVSSTGESIVNAYKDDTDRIKQISAESKTDIERQAEEGTREIVRGLQRKNQDLRARLEKSVEEGQVWKKRYLQLEQESKNPNSCGKEFLSGETVVEFGSELLPINIEYNLRTQQFSAWIPSEVTQRVLSVLRGRP